ncbi:MAG TPA: long-chain fatty acid--CoA ligase [bacterium]
MTNAAAQDRAWFRFYEPGVPRTIAYPRIAIPAFLDDSASRFPRHVATVFFGARLTYRTLEDLANRFAASLVRLGVKPLDRVSLHLPNSPQFLIAYYGTLKAGAIVVPFNPLYVEREIEHQLVDSGAEVAVTLDLMYPKIAAVRSGTRVREIVVTAIHDFFPPVLRVLYPLKARREDQPVDVPAAADIHRLTKLLNAPAAAPAVSMDPDGTAVLLYTGGTTGVPKGAELTHRNLVCNTLQARSWFTSFRPGEGTLLAVIPFFHSYGMTSAMNFCVSGGARLILLPRFQTDMVFAAMKRYRPSMFPGVPTMYTAIINHPDAPRIDMRSIEACISGAMALPGEVQSRFEAMTGGRLVEGYGLTETSPVTHINPIHGTRKAGSIGVPVPDTDARIVDAEDPDRLLGIDEPGELTLRGPQVMRGYWKHPDETARVMRGEWLLTGDIAKMDADGFFYIVDRKKELIISGGLNIFPREVEEVLYLHPAVLEGAAIGVPDDYRGEAVKAFVVLKPGAQATAEDIIAHCGRHLARFKVPKTVEFRNQLPKSMVGKILRRVLSEEDRDRRN